MSLWGIFSGNMRIIYEDCSKKAMPPMINLLYKPGEKLGTENLPQDQWLILFEILNAEVL